MNTLARLSLLIVLLLSVPPLRATPSIRPHGTSITGTIDRVDALSRTIFFTQDDGTVRRLVWIRWAVFVQAGLKTSPALLRPGMRVELRYHNPLFGSDYFSRVTLMPRTSSVTSQR